MTFHNVSKHTQDLVLITQTLEIVSARWGTEVINHCFLTLYYLRLLPNLLKLKEALSFYYEDGTMVYIACPSPEKGTSHYCSLSIIPFPYR